MSSGFKTSNPLGRRPAKIGASLVFSPLTPCLRRRLRGRQGVRGEKGGRAQRLGSHRQDTAHALDLVKNLKSLTL